MRCLFFLSCGRVHTPRLTLPRHEVYFISESLRLVYQPGAAHVTRDDARNAEHEAAGVALARVRDGAGLRELTCAVQQALGYIPPHVVPLLAATAKVERPDVFELIATNPAFSFTPAGRHRIAICLGRNCTARGAGALAGAARRALSLDFFQTTPDRLMRLEPFYCFGKCAQGPNVRIDSSIHGSMTESRLLNLLDDLRKTA